MSTAADLDFADLFVPDGSDARLALSRTTHLGIGAHADDLELLATHGILECRGSAERWFSGVVVTDGRGSSRSGAFASVSDDEMVQVRRREQREAARLGEYSAQVQLLHPSAAVKEAAHAGLAADLARVLELTEPRVVYTHCLTDQHDTHVALALRVIAALRRLPAAKRPERVLGCEVWRDLDWLVEADKVRLPLDDEPLQEALLRVFESQLAGGKRYDLAALGRRRAHATFAESHAVDRHRGVLLAMDLTPLMTSDEAPAEFAQAMIRRFEAESLERLRRLT